MKEDYDFVSKSTGFFIEITNVVPYREATFDGPAEGGDIYFRAYNERELDRTGSSRSPKKRTDNISMETPVS